jgi:hypothetical protein
MKYMTVWRVRPGAAKEAVKKFLETSGAPVDGVTYLGQWFSTDGTSGFTLSETDNPAHTYRNAIRWADLLEFQMTVVVEKDDAAPLIAEWYKNNG